MKINYHTVSQNTADGFGTSSRDIFAALQKQGIECTPQYQKVGLTYTHPDALIYSKADIKILYTMFESTRPPESWREYIEEADVVINPTEWGAETFKKKYGVDCEVVPLGIKTNIFEFQERPDRKMFTFLQFDVNKRKGLFETWEAFRQEFDESEPVRMVFKTSKVNNIFPPLCDNMVKIVEEYTPYDLVTLMQQADCFVFPSRGEGFGHTPLEALATGLPVITLDAHGISSYFDDRYMIGVDHHEIDAEYDYINEDNLGVMYRADIDDLRKKMRWAYENRPKLIEMGREGAKYASQWTWERTAKQLKEIIERYG